MEGLNRTPPTTDSERLLLIEEVVTRVETHLVREVEHVKRRVTSLEQFRWKLAGAIALGIVAFEVMFKHH